VRSGPTDPQASGVGVSTRLMGGAGAGSPAGNMGVVLPTHPPRNVVRDTGGHPL
jgi:hypothetical protein